MVISRGDCVEGSWLDLASENSRSADHALIYEKILTAGFFDVVLLDSMFAVGLDGCMAIMLRA
jgi:hypothetical protein